MRDDGMTLAGVDIASIVLRKADTLTPVTEKDHSISLPHSVKRVFQSREASKKRSGMETESWQQPFKLPGDYCYIAVSKFFQKSRKYLTGRFWQLLR